eukprot:CAMPEP_0170210640 /NCGR_PEP_ID=MMETSP0116_2-20130129/4929_1 /TAXON_ID=400756 /ORGANISM="Durinskia baltica, Strain CSIRO CS-38" /LENGTH=78 /DNA_ID=CAMNT_0010461161 /DNA_START=312 /DNA_END=548 /DNA_ORIENTATION=+
MTGRDVTSHSAGLGTWDVFSMLDHQQQQSKKIEPTVQVSKARRRSIIPPRTMFLLLMSQQLQYSTRHLEQEAECNLVM